MIKFNRKQIITTVTRETIFNGIKASSIDSDIMLYLDDVIVGHVWEDEELELIRDNIWELKSI